MFFTFKKAVILPTFGRWDGGHDWVDARFINPRRERVDSNDNLNLQMNKV